VDVPNTVTLVTRFVSALKAPSTSPVPHRREDALAVLSATRGVLSRGWVQRSWYLVETPAGRRHDRHRFFPSRLDHRQIVGACLVGGVMHGAWLLSPKPEYAYPAIDALWRTLFDPRAETAADPVGPVAPPLVRAARVRDLTTWNDRDYRTRDDVLQLVDAAMARLARRESPARA
jgi:hypothetical protein